MANPLDQLTQSDPIVDEYARMGVKGLVLDPDGMYRVHAAQPEPDPTSGAALDNRLTQAVQPEPPSDLTSALAKLRDYLLLQGVEDKSMPDAPKGLKRLFGVGGEERYQTWPERILRSGATLPGDVMSGAEPIRDPDTGRISDRVIERAQDMAALAGGGALTEKPGVASLGSGPIRRADIGATAMPKPDPKNAVYEGVRPESGMRQTKVPLSEYRHQDLDPLVEQHITKYGLPEAETVPVKDLRATQHNVDKHHDWDGNPDSEPYGADLPVGIRGADGKIHLVDGGHTTDQAIRQRQQNITAYVIDSTRLLSDTQKPGAAIAGAAKLAETPKSAPMMEPIRGLDQALPTLEMAKDIPGTPEQWASHFEQLPEIKNALALPEFQQSLGPNGTATGAKVADFLKKVQAIPEQPKPGLTDMDRRSFIRGAASLAMNAPRIMKFVGKALDAPQVAQAAVGPTVKLINPSAAVKYGMSPAHEKDLIRYIAEIEHENGDIPLKQSMSEARQMWKEDPDLAIEQYGRDAFGDHLERGVLEKMGVKPGEGIPKGREKEFNQHLDDMLSNDNIDLGHRYDPGTRFNLTPPQIVTRYSIQNRGSVDESGLFEYGYSDVRDHSNGTWKQFPTPEEAIDWVEARGGDIAFRTADGKTFPTRKEAMVHHKELKNNNYNPRVPTYDVRKYQLGAGDRYVITKDGHPMVEHAYLDEGGAKQGLAKLNATLFSDTQKPGAAIAAAASQPAPVFYSALEHAATNAAQDTMSPQQWLGYLKNQPGVKKEELDWTGLEGWLGEQKGKVNKADVQQYLDAHKTELKDVTKSSNYGEGDEAVGNYMEEHGERLRHEAERDVRRAEPDLEGDDFETAVEEAMMEAADDEMRGGVGGGGSATKYSGYQLPGGENYREHLITMPERKTPPPPEVIKAVEDANAAIKAHEKDLRKKYGRDASTWYDNMTPEEKTRGVETSTAVNRANAELGKYRYKKVKDNYRSSHWDEPNVLAHVRTNDRMLEDPGFRVVNDKSGNTSGYFKTREEAEKYQNDLPASIRGQTRVSDKAINPIKSLHIEEIQSDWHQQGRKQGYQVKPTDISKWTAEFHSKDNPSGTYNPGYDYWVVKGDDGVTRGVIEGGKGLGERGAAQKWVDTNQHQPDKVKSGVPDAPFKTTWPELALKRMIRHAAENGYDRISWTPGEAQAARYDLSKQVNSIRAQRNKDGTWRLIGKDKNDHYVPFGDNIEESKLPDMVGKDLAEKIADQVIDNKEYSGVDLKVGGEGMREFYDKMLPKMAEKIGKAHGVKVKTTQIEENPGNYGVSFPRGSQTDYHVTNERGEHVQTGFKTEAEAREWAKNKKIPYSVHYFDLPQSLKDQALHKGFPLYMQGIPFPLTPVDNDPFKKDK